MDGQGNSNRTPRLKKVGEVPVPKEESEQKTRLLLPDEPEFSIKKI